MSTESDRSNFACITFIFNNETSQLDIVPADCTEQHRIICRKVYFRKPDCDGTIKQRDVSRFEVLSSGTSLATTLS